MRGPWSITGRLGFLYALSALSLLLMGTLFLYWVLVSSLEGEDNEFLVDKIYVLRAIVRERPGNREALEEEVKWEGKARLFARYYARILDERGRTLIETTGMGDVLAPGLFPTPVGVTVVPPQGTRWTSRDGTAYLLMAARAELGRLGGHEWRLQVALDVSHEDHLIADYRRKLAGVLFLGIMLSAGAGVAVARKGMHPLEEIASAAQRITARQLHERIDPAQWPKELTTLATAFNAMLSRLEGSFTRLLQFSADLAHELRTPINNLMGEAEVALSSARTTSEYRQVLESALEEYARLTHTVDGLLFLARAESAGTRIDRSPFDTLQEIEAIREFYDAVAQERGIEVACRGKAVLRGDRTLFRRAVSNLLSNALQYTQSGGGITVSVAQPDDQSVEVSVSDTGPGIDRGELPRVFERFYRGDRARSQYPPGTGLGLAIVKSIMNIHNGTVAIQSEPGQGTTVILKFPPPN